MAMPASVAFSVVAEDSSITPCDSDISRAARRRKLDVKIRDITSSWSGTDCIPGAAQACQCCAALGHWDMRPTHI